MAFQLNDTLLDELHEAVASGNEVFIKDRLSGLHPADIAQVINHLSQQDAIYVYQHIDEESAPETLIELDEDVRELILAELTPQEIAEQYIDNLDSDDAADVIAELPDHQQGQVLSHMEDAEQASDIVDLLNYDPDTAGGIMATELIRANINTNVWECVREIRRQAEEVENIYTIYVVDDEERLVGLLSLKNLLTKPLRTPIRELYNPTVISVKTNVQAEEVAQVMDKYDLVVIPVVDQLGRLMGLSLIHI